jgi:protein SCO1/2
MRVALVLALAMVASIGPALLVDVPRHASDQQRLPEIAPAPAFTLISQDRARVSLADLRGKVAAVTFIYTLCGDTCPVLTPMMAIVADRLGRDFGRKVCIRLHHDRP